MSEERMQFQNANLSRSVFSLSFSLQAELEQQKLQAAARTFCKNSGNILDAIHSGTPACSEKLVSRSLRCRGAWRTRERTKPEEFCWDYRNSLKETLVLVILSCLHTSLLHLLCVTPFQLMTCRHRDLLCSCADCTVIFVWHS